MKKISFLSLLLMLPSLAIASIQMGETVYYTQGSSNDPKAYVDYVASDNDLLSSYANYKNFFYGDQVAYQSSQWFYYYQIEYIKDSAWGDPAYLSRSMQLAINNIGKSNLLSAGYLLGVYFDLDLNHYVPGEHEEAQVLAGIPSYGLLTDPNPSINLFRENYVFQTNSTSVKLMNQALIPILFLSSSEPPAFQNSKISLSSFHNILSVDNNSLDSSMLLAPGLSYSSVPEPSLLFLCGFIVMLVSFKKKI